MRKQKQGILRCISRIYLSGGPLNPTQLWHQTVMKGVEKLDKMIAYTQGVRGESIKLPSHPLLNPINAGEVCTCICHQQPLAPPARLYFFALQFLA